jgi:hypothetical protein
MRDTGRIWPGTAIWEFKQEYDIHEAAINAEKDIFQPHAQLHQVAREVTGLVS